MQRPHCCLVYLSWDHTTRVDRYATKKRLKDVTGAPLYVSTCTTTIDFSHKPRNMPFAGDDAVAVLGLMAAFKGAIDGYLLIESFFDKDNKSWDLAVEYHIQKLLLENWRDFQNINAPDWKNCRLSNANTKDQKIVLHILARITTLNKEAERFIKKHLDTNLLADFTSESGQSGASGPESLNSAAVNNFASQQMQAKQKGRMSWSIKDKAKFNEIVQQLRHYNRDLTDLFSRRDAQLFDSVLPSQMLAGLNDEEAIKKLREQESDRVLLRHAASLKLMQQGLSRVPAAQIIQEEEITPRLSGIGQSRKSLGVRNFKNIWIEWRLISNQMSDSQRSLVRDRQHNLSGILSSVTDASLRIPQHEGVIEVDEISGSDTQTWIGFVNAVPRDCTAKVPESLYHIIAACAEPPLGEKFRLVAELAKSLSIFHSASWLHKAFRSDNVIFFEGEAVEAIQYPSITNPFITGFGVARPDLGVSIETKPTGKGAFDHYYHPGAQNGATKAFDWYSFGIIMLEIAHWKLVPVMIEEQNIAAELRQDLAGIQKICQDSVEFLPAITGSRFSKVVGICLGAKLAAVDDGEMARLVATEIVQVLERLWA